MSPARNASVFSQSIDTSLAGTNRSGTHRLLPELAGSETAASNSLAGATADSQVQVTDKPYGTDRDSEGSSVDKESLKDLEKEMLQAKERFEKEKANRENRARRIRTGTA